MKSNYCKNTRHSCAGYIAVNKEYLTDKLLLDIQNPHHL